MKDFFFANLIMKWKYKINVCGQNSFELTLSQIAVRKSIHHATKTGSTFLSQSKIGN